MLTGSAMVTLAKICATFGVMLFFIRRDWGLWAAIGVGALLLGLLFGMSLPDIGATVLQTLPQPSFITLFAVVTFIMLLSEIQGKSGQGQRLVAGLTPYMKSPRLRLIFFPALVGLLPMPGGAIFSCPMVRDVAERFDIPDKEKVIINYWFRHIWESAWPLYPGYILACALGGIPPSMLWRYTFPFVFVSLSVGWVFFLRHPVRALPGHEDDLVEKRPLPHVLLEGLPIAIAILGAFVLDPLLSLVGVALPSGSVFIFSFLAASVTAMLQNAMSPLTALRLITQPKVIKLLAVIVMIFIFKEVVVAARVADHLAALITDRSAMLALFVFLPMLMGMLTGLMMGFVGASFPLLMGMLMQAGLYEERFAWVLVALVSGHFGQMVTPLHSCYMVTVEFFRSPFSASWRAITAASLTQLGIALAYIALLTTLVTPHF